MKNWRCFFLPLLLLFHGPFIMIWSSLVYWVLYHPLLLCFYALERKVRIFMILTQLSLNVFDPLETCIQAYVLGAEQSKKTFYIKIHVMMRIRSWSSSSYPDMSPSILFCYVTFECFDDQNKFCMQTLTITTIKLKCHSTFHSCNSNRYKNCVGFIQRLLSRK